MDKQPFLNWDRFDARVTSAHVQQMAGLFHVTTQERFADILKEGLKPGINLTETGRGRVDIHILLAPPQSHDVLNNQRIQKMWSKGYREVVVICIKLEALDFANARINQQGVVLQRSCIPPNMIDYAIKVTEDQGNHRCEWLYACEVKGEVEAVRETGFPLSEWRRSFLDKLKACGDTEPAPTTA